jgi:formate transporter
MLGNNLLPVTLGNILGGVVLVALIYWTVYHKRENGVDTSKTNLT